MIQQINLYQDEFKRVTNWAQAGMLAVAALLILVLVGGSVYQSSALGELESQLAAKNKQLKSIEDSFGTLQAESKPKAKDMNLAERVQRVKRANEEKIRAKNYLTSDGAGNITGFSSLLQGLGRQRDAIEDLWLRNIQFSEGGFHMRLLGSNYRPELLPAFIQALNNEELYRDREFREIKITRSEEDGKVMDFVLSTRHKTADPDIEQDESAKALFMARLKRLKQGQVSQ